MTFMRTNLLSRTSVIVVSLALNSAMSLTAATSYDPAAGFSTTTNPNGVWSYGYYDSPGSPLILHTQTTNFNGIDVLMTNVNSNVPNAMFNPTASSITYSTLTMNPGGFAIHPGPSLLSVARFTAPSAVDLHILGSFFGYDTGGTTTDVHLYNNNGLSVFDGLVSGYGPGSGPSFDLTLSLSAGEHLDFAVGPNGDFRSDSTGITAELTVVPEPSSALMLVSGCVMLLTARRRTSNRQS